MAGQYCGGGKEEWEMASECGFTDLNKAYPKDHFPMPRINQLVDAAVSDPRISFLNDFQGTTKYH